MFSRNHGPGRSARIVESENARMLTSHRHFTAELRIHLSAYNLETALTTFTRRTRQKKDDWFDIYKFFAFNGHSHSQYDNKKRPHQKKKFRSLPTITSPNEFHKNFKTKYSNKSKDNTSSEISAGDGNPLWKKNER